MKIIRCILLSGLWVLLSSTSYADEPPAPPATHEVSSAGNEFTAISSPADGTRVFFNKTKKELWAMPDWYRSLFLSDDGNYVVTGYDGLNLIPIDYSDDIVILTFWHMGNKIREVSLGEIVPDPSVLIRTASHYHWGSIEGIDADGKLKVKRADGRILVYDITTGLNILRGE